MINQFSYKKICTAAVIAGCFFMYGCENDVNEVRELGRKKASIDEGKGFKVDELQQETNLSLLLPRASARRSTPCATG